MTLCIRLCIRSKIECSVEVKQIVKLFIQCDAKNQRQFRRGAELACFNGAYRISRNPNHFSQGSLREFFFRPRRFQPVLQYNIIFQGMNPPRSLIAQPAE